MSRHILFVEDEVPFATGVVDRLHSEGYEVELKRTGTVGYQRAREYGFDLIILDVMLPGKNGFDICRDLRRDSVNTPILLLTARGETVDRVVGLKLGADDYLVKPFAIPELLARVEALLRRNLLSNATEACTAHFGAVRVDLARNEVTRSGKLVTLSRAEFRLLRYLLEHRGAIVTRDELLKNVWGLNGDTMTRTVDVHVASLRKKIEADPSYPEYLITLKGFGYKLMSS
jgi:two-component system, OmpR family, alkaline phosphatase synthesis response regulator PhoP